mmetsp:Transcript_29832/g.77245  ORF Transcript_29832/g.77245 Transcript_29832/m.77245 type:complete len:93 (+) Transcript_29832:286-564(+)
MSALQPGYAHKATCSDLHVDMHASLWSEGLFVSRQRCASRIDEQCSSGKEMTNAHTSILYVGCRTRSAHATGAGAERDGLASLPDRLLAEQL